MHDPLIVLFHVRWLDLDVWHREPGGHDSGEVCGHPPQPVAARIVWAARHWRHLYVRFWPYLHVQRWIVDRCDGCGRRFGWREARYSYMSTNRVWHDPCMSLRHVRGQLDDLTGYVLGIGDDNGIGGRSTGWSGSRDTPMSRDVLDLIDPRRTRHRRTR